jgi:hypothetical protein
VYVTRSKATFSYATLTPDSARDASTEWLVKAMNECRPDSGAHLAARTELERRADVKRNWRRVGVALVLGAIALAFGFLS